MASIKIKDFFNGRFFEIPKYQRGYAWEVQNIRDLFEARFEIAEMRNSFHKSHQNYSSRPRYWMDFGNSQQAGQVILSIIGEVRQPKSDTYQMSCPDIG